MIPPASVQAVRASRPHARARPATGGHNCLGAQQRMAMGYEMDFRAPVNAILLGRAHGTFWGTSGNHGQDYGSPGNRKGVFLVSH
jgi:hypothetical protein